MPNPKRRQLQSPTRLASCPRPPDGAEPQRLPELPEPKLPHRVCPRCGHYKGKQVIEAEEV